MLRALAVDDSRGDYHSRDHVGVDRTVVLVSARRVKRIAERLPLVEQAAVLHAILERHRMRRAILVRPGH